VVPGLTEAGSELADRIFGPGTHASMPWRRGRLQCGSRGEGMMPDTRPPVCVVDDDESVRESLPDLLNELGYSVRAFSSALEFPASDALGRTRCLILDIVMPGMTDIELQAESKHRGKQIPIIFITATSDETIRARVVDLGTAAYLPNRSAKWLFRRRSVRW
jgi:CheY-like chemotaxis protein